MLPQRELDDAQCQAVRALAAQACADMFAALGLQAALLEPPPVDGEARPSPQNIVSSIAFTGPVRGTLVLVSSMELFRLCHPAAGRPPAPSQADVVDWAGEIANQLLGRIKGRFFACGVDFQASTPKAAVGAGVPADPPPTRTCRLAFRAGEQELVVVLYLESVADPRLFKDSAEPIDGYPEGDLVIF